MLSRILSINYELYNEIVDNFLKMNYFCKMLCFSFNPYSPRPPVRVPLLYIGFMEVFECCAL
jgi:hypothetical protein